MAKLTRKLQKIFGKNAGLNERGKIGSLAAGSIEYSTDPDGQQELANFEDGLFSIVLGNNSPALQDMNSLHNLTTRQLAYLFENGIPEYQAGTNYFINSRAVDVATGILYISLSDDNLGNALTDYTNWKPFSDVPTATGLAFHGATLPVGYVFASSKTIGSTASGAIERANDDTYFLFKEFWDGYDNTVLVIQDSAGVDTTRGASALIDFELDKRLPTIDMRGRVAAGRDDMGGVAASRMTVGKSGINGALLGSSGGAEEHVLIIAEMPTHTHTQNSHSHTATTYGGAGFGSFFASPVGGGSGSATTNAATATNNNTGSGGAHQNTQPTLITNWIVKL